jgi:hypothetical protein
MEILPPVGHGCTRTTQLSRGLAAVGIFPTGAKNCASIKNKKADVAEHPKVFDHVGLLFNEPPGKAGLFFV